MEIKKIVSAVLGVFLLIVVMFYMRKLSRYVERSVPFLEQELQEEAVWRGVQERANNSVIQVFVDVAYFNWSVSLLPIKSISHDMPSFLSI